MDTYEIVTEKIISLLEIGIVPWRRPWATAGRPRNLVSSKPYRGINYFLLSASQYVSPFWLTMRQTNELGGSIRKSEKSTIVTFWKIDGPTNNKTEDVDREPTEDKNRRRFVLRFYRVWNLEQCDLPQSVRDKLPKIEMHEHAPIDVCAEIIARMPSAPEIVHAGSKAVYSPTADRVTLPPMELFTEAEEYYATAFHELIHSVGHEKRVGRDSIREAAPFGSATYTFEELVAEMGAAYLCAEAKISPAVIENQASYVDGWLKQLRRDRRLIIKAATHAQRAVNFILNKSVSS